MSSLAIVGIVAAGVVVLVIGRQKSARLSVAELIGQPPRPIRDAHDDTGAGRAAIALRRMLAGRLGTPLRSVADTGVSAGLERELLLAGVANTIGIEEVVAAQALGATVGLVVTVAASAAGLASGVLALALGACLVFIGGIAPRVLLRRRGAERQRRIDARVSDALDLLTMCVEAGLGFDAAMATVSTSIPPPLGNEFERTVAEMRLGLSRAESLENLRRRNDSRALNAFVVALLQADTLGTPVGRVLAGQAAEARLRRRQEARERAGQLPVRILIPTVLLIFPPTFVILLGPAMSSIQGAF